MSQELSHDDRGRALDAVLELEALGYSTIWLPGSQGNNLSRIADVVRATREVRVASAIIPVDVVPAHGVARAFAALNSTHPDRFVVGVGGAHGRKPLETLRAYLDELDAEQPPVPADARVLAALGPRMLELARDRTGGALPYLVTPEYTAQARNVLGGDAALAIGLPVVLEPNPDQGRAVARSAIRFLKSVPPYAANFRRMGFTGDDISQSSDRLIDSLVAWGDVGAIAARVKDHLEAGADHVALSVNARPGDALPVEAWRELAEALVRS
jgi:probable F420-dependent oxidoreductase